jgi:hypothetical protein
MCYCIYDADGICELSDFNTGKTSSGECSYTYSDPEDIKCDKREEGWHEEEYESDYPSYYYDDEEEEGGEDFDLEVDEEMPKSNYTWTPSGKYMQ